MAAARQKEMNDSMTVVATTTLTVAGPLSRVCHGNHSMFRPRDGAVK
jgi:hypothetical protein